MFWLKKIIFKFMELGLGLRTCFSLETKDPIFVNFKLSDSEAEAVRKTLPSSLTLRKIRFSESDLSPEYWVSYNLYELRYPKKELQAIRKVRCEINTFVEDSQGRKGVYVFCGSPYVSKETAKSLIGHVCDFAEKLVMFIYGCGKLIPLVYEISAKHLSVHLIQGPNRLSLEQAMPADDSQERLSTDYHLFNDISFFNEAKTFDLVNVNSHFLNARFTRLRGETLRDLKVVSPFFERAPDDIYVHRGEISYMVNSLHRSFHA